VRLFGKTIKPDFADKGMSKNDIGSDKLYYLESVRGVAAFTVLLSHIAASYYPAVTFGPSVAINSSIMFKLFYGLPFGFLTTGSFAVVLFFTLSGFVLTNKYIKTKQMKDLLNQVAKRYIRLAIPIFCVVMVAYFMISNGLMKNTLNAYYITDSPTLMQIFSIVPNFAGALYNALFGVLINKNASFDPVMWTMPIELVGSFIVFGMAALVNNFNKRWFLYAGIIIFLGSSYYVCFVLGMLLADLVNNTNFVVYVRKNVSKVYIIILSIAVLIIASFPYPLAGLKGMIFEHMLIPGLDSIYIYSIWQFLGAFILLAIVLVSPKVQKFLNAKILVFMGGISFAFYLTHYLVLHSLGDSIFVRLYPKIGLHYSVLITSIATLLVTLCVSIIWKKYIDDFSVRVSRRFSGYILK